MAVKFLFFAQSSNIMKCKKLIIDLDEPVNLNSLLRSKNEFRPLKDHLKFLKVSVNQTIENLDCIVKDGDEVAFLPPFSGG